MYRKKDGSRGFSFTKLADIIVPNFFADTRPSAISVLFSLRQDMLYNHQLASRNFKQLDGRALFVAGVVDNERVSKTCFKALQKAEILSDDGIVDTYKIGPRFTHQLVLLNQYRQRDLVNLLFWWEEECRRFDKLMDEDRDLTSMVDEAELFATEDQDDVARREAVDRLKFARERVRMKVRQRPSQRREDTENDTDDIMAHFQAPAQSALGNVNAGGINVVHRSMSGLEPGSGRAGSAPAGQDELPDYQTVAAKQGVGRLSSSRSASGT